MSKCQVCNGSGLTGPGLPIIGCGPCALCGGTGQLPEFKVRILSTEVELHDKPRYIAWYGGECPVEPNLMMEVVLAGGSIGVGLSNRYVWRHGNTTIFDIIAYRVIEQE